jgi:hypothetical protein
LRWSGRGQYLDGTLRGEDLSDPERIGVCRNLQQRISIMNKHSATDRTASGALPAEPVRLTAEEAKQVAGGLAAAVIGVGVRCCLTCGIGALGPYADKLS